MECFHKEVFGLGVLLSGIIFCWVEILWGLFGKRGRGDVWLAWSRH